MTTFTNFEKIIKGLEPFKSKATPSGLLLSYSIKKCVLVIVRPGSVGIISTQYNPLCFTLLENSVFYMCWNTDEKCTQVRCVSSTGVETLIINPHSFIVDLNTTRDNRCVVLNNTRDDQGCLNFLNHDGSANIIKKNLVKATEFSITEQNTFLVIYESGILEVNMDGTSQRRVLFDNWCLKSTLRNIVSLPDSFLVIDERSIVKYRRGPLLPGQSSTVPQPTRMCSDMYLVASTNCRRNEGEKIFGEQDFCDLGIGKYIKSFHLNREGIITLVTTKGICCLGDNYKFPIPERETAQVSSYLWNPKMVQIIKHSYEYAITFILCMNKIYETDEELPEVPLELFHLMLSHSDMWSFPGKTLSLL